MDRIALNVLKEASSTATAQLVDCGGCTQCCERGGLVFIHPAEREDLSRLGVPMVNISGVLFIKRLVNGECPMLDKANRKCSIYESRPLCCRMFPLDVLQMEGQLQWSVETTCPSERRHFGDGKSSSTKLGTGTVARIAASLNANLTPDDVAFFDKKERVANNVELSSDYAAGWTNLCNCG